MKHLLGRGVIGPWPFLDISAEDFESTKIAKENIFTLLGTEEKFAMIIGNYLEYERDLLNLALVYMTSHSAEWADMQDAKALVNRRLANLLTASRLYVHQVKQDLVRAYGKNAGTTTQIRQAFVEQSNNLLGYRVMEQIRNVVQHRSLPISRISYPTHWEEAPRLLHHRVSVKVNIRDLRDDSRFERSILRELESIGPDDHDITPFVRQYVEGLSCVHKELRAASVNDIATWKNIILEIIERYRGVCADDVKNIVMYRLDDNENTIEEISVFTESVDRLIQYRRNLPPTSISHWFVSNQGISN